MRRLAIVALLSALIGGGAGGAIAYRMARPGTSRPDPDGLPVTCTQAGKIGFPQRCYQGGQQVTAPHLGPCLANSNDQWQAVTDFLQSPRAFTGTERGLFDTYACFSGD